METTTSNISSELSRLRSAERHLRICELFSSQEFIDSETLCRTLRVSDSTVRRDLIELEKKGLVRRVHGGALSLQTKDEGLDFHKLATHAHDEKMRIGKAAAALVQDRQNVLLAPGTTVLEVAKCLFGRSIQVVTNSVPLVDIFWDCKDVEVTLTGGYLYPRIGVLLGGICEEMLDKISADVLILGMAGLTEDGLSDSNTLIVGTILKMISAARRVIVVADHTKFGRKSMVHVTGWKDVDMVVSDSGLAPEYQKMLKDRGVECLLA